MNRAAPLALLAAIGLPTPVAAKAVPPGIYGDVRLSPKTGDLGGTELEVIGTGAETRVEFVHCEGWCGEVILAPAKLTPTGLVFAYTEKLHDAQANPVAGDRYVVEVSPAGSGVRIRMTQAERVIGSGRLERLREPFGLDVARHAAKSGEPAAN